MAPESDLDDYLKEFTDQVIEEPTTASEDWGDRLLARLRSKSHQRLQLWVTRCDGPADLPSLASLEPELLEATPGSLRLLVPSRGEYAAMYAAVGALAVLFLLFFWLTGIGPFHSPIESMKTGNPGEFLQIISVTFIGGMAIIGSLGALSRSRTRRHPGKTVPVSALEVIPKRTRVYLKVSDGQDAYWLSATAPNSYATGEAWWKYVRKVLSLAGQTSYAVDT